MGTSGVRVWDLGLLALWFLGFRDLGFRDLELMSLRLRIWNLGGRIQEH